MAFEYSYPQQRQEVLQASSFLMQSGVMSHTGHVNFSCRVDDSGLLFSSTGLIHELSATPLALLDTDGNLKEGHISASTREILPMHLAVYRSRDDAVAVVHTHSPHLTAFALVGRSLPCRYEAMFRRGQDHAVPVVEWSPRGSTKFTQAIAQALSRWPTTLALLLANHGVLAFGASPMAAAKLVAVLEEAAEAEIRAAAIGGARDLPPEVFEDTSSAPDEAPSPGPS
ncbi:MAG: class II aldolase/adducin family protein [Actinomycetota bacterium]|nr:class II aldolase/adducin family protein [Actinomycetota bacterium]